MSETAIQYCPVHRHSLDEQEECYLCVREAAALANGPRTVTEEAGDPTGDILLSGSDLGPDDAPETAVPESVVLETAMPDPAGRAALEAQIRDLTNSRPDGFVDSGMSDQPQPERTVDPLDLRAQPPEPDLIIEEAASGDVPIAVLQRLIDEKRTVISLLGFRGAGKTWFMNRLKYQLFTSDDGFDCLPEHEGQGEAVERTAAISTHFFEPKHRSGDEKPFYVVDMPGERFLGITRGELGNRTRELLTLKASRALMIVLPADEVLLGQKARALYPRSRPTAETEIDFGIETGPDRTRKGRPRRTTPQRLAEIMAANEVRLERFTASMSKLRARLSLLEGGAAPEAVARMSDDDLAAHLDSQAYRAPTKPVFVALSKADILEQQIREIAAKPASSTTPVNVMDLLVQSPADLDAMREFDADPLDTIRRFRPTLASAFSSFPWCKFDFVTAFRGHGGTGVDATTVDYTLGRRGISAVIRWMEWARDADATLTPRQWRYVAAARAIRRFRDEGRFRRARKGGFR